MGNTCEDSVIGDSKDEVRERTSSVHQFLGEPVVVNAKTLQESIAGKSFSPLAFELYKEATCLVAVSSHVYSSSSPEERVLPRNQAICAGLLVRIAKLMTTVANLIAQASDYADVVLALNRFITESATDLRFLVIKNEDRFFDQFVNFSLSSERELYDVIQSNLAERGGETWSIEQRMLRSIDKVCRLSGVTISDIQPKASNWGGGLRNRLKALGEDALYAMQQRIPSHAVHGTWVDLVERFQYNIAI